jgi:hypothetical protein
LKGLRSGGWCAHWRKYDVRCKREDVGLSSSFFLPILANFARIIKNYKGTMRQRIKKFSVTTKLSGEEFLLLEDLAMREGKSRFQLMHDILMERLESEFGEIDYGIPSDWLPQPRARRTRRKPTSIELQLNFNFYDDGIDSITDRDNIMRGAVQKGNKKAKRKGVQRLHNV